eukprot:SAG31_NODE_1862_length_7044_cov_11.784017_4_plen_127_part_00
MGRSLEHFQGGAWIAKTGTVSARAPSALRNVITLLPWIIAVDVRWRVRLRLAVERAVPRVDNRCVELAPADVVVERARAVSRAVAAPDCAAVRKPEARLRPTAHTAVTPRSHLIDKMVPKHAVEKN